MKWLDGLTDLRGGPQRTLLALGVVAILALAGIAWWAVTPTYTALFHDLPEQDAAEIVAKLREWQLPYRFGEDQGTLLVPQDQLYETRMRLVGEGVPKHGTVGFELFKEADYGMTEFAQKVNYQRALQGELERTIVSLEEVSDARVHLTLRRTGLFLRDQDPPKASITITPREGQALNPRQVAGIRNLVAAAVEGLMPDAVVVLDNRGVALASAGGTETGAGDLDQRIAEQQRLESALHDKVAGLLTKLFALQDFTVSVEVRMNYDRVKSVREQLIAQGADGNGLLLRRKDTHSRGPATDARGQDAAGAGGTEVEYAHGKSMDETVYATGRVERLSVGIFLPPSSLTTADQARLREVVAAAIGIDVARGDKLEIAALAATAVRASTAQGTSASPSGATPVSGTAAAASTPLLRDWNVIVLALLLGLAVGALFLRSGPPRLSAPQRERTLAELRGWLEPNAGARS